MRGQESPVLSSTGADEEQEEEGKEETLEKMEGKVYKK